MNRRLTQILYATIIVTLIVATSSCSTTKYVGENEYLLSDVEVKCYDKNIDASQFSLYVRQKTNSKWFSAVNIPLGIYGLSGSDTAKWINRTLRKLGEQPVLYDSIQAFATLTNLRTALHNMGYLQGDVDMTTHVKGKKLKTIYTLQPGRLYYIGSMDYIVEDEAIAAVLGDNRGLSSGMVFSLENLENERKRITSILNDKGYYKFNKDFIIFEADSIAGSYKVDLTLHLLKYRASNNDKEKEHPQYHLRNIRYTINEEGVSFRRHMLENNTIMTEGEAFCSSDLQKTYNKFAKLQAVRYTNISFNEATDTTLLDCNIHISPSKINTISFQPEGTNTAGDLGAAASLTYENRNLFRGSEVLSIQLRGAFEAITGLEGYQNENYEEYNIEAKLMFPRFIAPFLSRQFRRRSNATSELTVSYNLQNRPEFHRRVFTSAWKYHWNGGKHNTSYRIDLLDLNYVYMPWISETFKSEYLDDDSNRNAILRYNYEDLFITKIGAGISYNNGKHAIKANIETSGNTLRAVSKLLNSEKNEDGQYTLFSIAYAQYVKADFDYTHLFSFHGHSSLSAHLYLGVAYPYGNSTILPFEKRYFSGGANSVRGWNVRELGPGKFKGTDGRIDFINQTGDIKLDFSIEYRASLFWKFDGALFIDAGNIWTIRDYEDQPGGQFKIDEFYKQIAAAYGIGIRLNLDYFILRLDMGMKAIIPSYTTNKEHYAIIHPDFSRDRSFHFAVGLPF